MADSIPLLFARNAERNLEEIEAFLEGSDGRVRFSALLTRLFDTIVPNLAQHPLLGADFLEHRVASVQGQLGVNSLVASLAPGELLREYVSGDYLVLYLVRPDDLVVLAIKHHRQLSYDLPAFWAQRQR